LSRRWSSHARSSEAGIEAATEAIHADIDFMKFILAYYGLTHCRELRPQPLSAAERKKLIRKILGAEAGAGGGILSEVRTEWRRRKQLRLRATLFDLEPLPPNPAHRPKNWVPLATCFALKNYFTLLSGVPHMDLVFRVVLPGWTAKSAAEYWSRHRAAFSEVNGRDLVGKLHTYYRENRERISAAVHTGTPLYGPLRRRVSKAAVAVRRPPRQPLGQSLSVADRMGRPLPEVLKEHREGWRPALPRVYCGSCPQCGALHQVLNWPAANLQRLRLASPPRPEIGHYCTGPDNGDGCGTWIYLSEPSDDGGGQGTHGVHSPTMIRRSLSSETRPPRMWRWPVTMSGRSPRVAFAAAMTSR
jgi:hypothetical protein